MQDKENVVEFFGKYLGGCFQRALTVDQFEIVCRKWQKAQRRDSGWGGWGHHGGGILSLASAINEHREAIEYDLLTYTGYQLSDLGNALDWTAMRTFMRHLPIDSAMGQELHPEYTPWATRTKTNAILADIFDVLQPNISLPFAGDIF